MERFVREAEQPPFNSTQFAIPPDLCTTSEASSPQQQQQQADDDLEYLNSFPPGHKFNPDDDELIVHYLDKKIRNLPLPKNKIVDVNIYKYNPKDLAGKYERYGSRVNKETKWYFFTPRDKKYRNGTRPNRAASGGYWKATGADKKVRHMDQIVGFRKSLVFYTGKPPKGDKTHWIMHEFRLADPSKPRITGTHHMKLDDWVLCSIHEKDARLNSKDDQQREDLVYNVDDDVECGYENISNWIVPVSDDYHSFPDPDYQSLLCYPLSSRPSTSFTPSFNFGSNHLVQDNNDRVDFGSFVGDFMMPNTPLTPSWNLNPTLQTPVQSHGIDFQEEVIHGCGFDELDPSAWMSIPDPSTWMSIPDPSLPAFPSENPPFQPTRIVEDFHNPPVKPIEIAQDVHNSVFQHVGIVEDFFYYLLEPIENAQDFDNSAVELSNKADESPAQLSTKKNSPETKQ